MFHKTQFPFIYLELFPFFPSPSFKRGQFIGPRVGGWHIVCRMAANSAHPRRHCHPRGTRATHFYTLLPEEHVAVVVVVGSRDNVPRLGLKMKKKDLQKGGLIHRKESWELFRRFAPFQTKPKSYEEVLPHKTSGKKNANRDPPSQAMRPRNSVDENR